MYFIMRKINSLSQTIFTTCDEKFFLLKLQ